MNQPCLGVSTLPWYYETDLISHLPLLVKAGIGRIELRRLAPHVDTASVVAVRRFAAVCRDHGLTLHSAHMPGEICLGMSAPDSAARRQATAEARHVAGVARELGCGILVTHTGGRVPVGTPRAEIGDLSLESLAELCAFCQTLGLPVALENTLPKEYGSVAEAVDMCDRLRSYGVGCCLDTSHANLAGNPVDALSTIGDRLLTVHLSDNDGQSDQHALPFDGTIDWARFMAALGRMPYSGVLMMEVRGGADYAGTLARIVERFRRLVSAGEAGPV